MNRFHPLRASFLGFDSFFNEVDRLLDATNSAMTAVYPPLNVYKDNEDYTIELAVAGFRDTDIKIEHDEKRGVLHITGDSGTGNDNRQVIQRGIAARRFVRSFTVADTLKVESASLENGLLTIKLVADEEKAYTPRQIPLTQTHQKALPAPEAKEGILEKLTGKKKEKVEQPA